MRRATLTAAAALLAAIATAAPAPVANQLWVTNKINEVIGTNTAAKIAAATNATLAAANAYTDAHGGGGVDTNAVNALIGLYDATNIAPRIATNAAAIARVAARCETNTAAIATNAAQIAANTAQIATNAAQIALRTTVDDVDDLVAVRYVGEWTCAVTNLTGATIIDNFSLYRTYSGEWVFEGGMNYNGKTFIPEHGWLSWLGKEASVNELAKVKDWSDGSGTTLTDVCFVARRNYTANRYGLATTNALMAAVAPYATTNALMAAIDHTAVRFSNEVLQVATGISTNDLAALGELAGLPVGEGAAGLGAVLAALVAAVLALKRKLPYALNAAATAQDRAINVVSGVSMVVPDDFTDLVFRLTVEEGDEPSLTLPAAITTDLGDDLPSDAGEYLVSVTKTGEHEAVVKVLGLEAREEGD